MEDALGIKGRSSAALRTGVTLLLVLALLSGCAKKGDSYADAPEEGIVSLVREAQEEATKPPAGNQQVHAPMELPVDSFYGDDMQIARYEIGLTQENMEALDAAQQGFPWYDSLNAADKLLYLEIYQIMVSQTRAKIWLSSFDYPSLVEVASLVMTDHPELNMGRLGQEVFVYDDVDGVRYWSLALPFPSEEDERYGFALPDHEIQAELRERHGLTMDQMEALYAKHEDRLHFQYLSEAERLAYVELYQAMEVKTEEPLLLTTEYYGIAASALYAIKHDYPRYCYEYIIHYSEMDENYRQYYWAVRHDGKSPEEALAEEDAAYAACVNLVSQMPQGLDEYEKVKWLYDWLVLNTTYTLSLESTDDEMKNADTLAQTILERKPICGGYATTMMQLCELAGIECWMISGYTDAELHGYHGWNIVKIDGIWYEMDACWGDLSRRDQNTGIYYDYGVVNRTWFLFTTKDAARRSRFYEKTWVPEGVGTNTWYVREGASFSVPDKDAIKAEILQQMSETSERFCVQLRFENEESFEAAKDWLFMSDEGNYIWYEGGGGWGFHYFYDDAMYTMILYAET